MLPNKDFVLVRRVHPQAGDGVVEQHCQGGLQAKWIHIGGIVTRDLLHYDYFSQSWMYSQAIGCCIEQIMGRHNCLLLKVLCMF